MNKTTSDEPAEPMAEVHYDFMSPIGFRLAGVVTVRCASDATAIITKLNAEYGEGSHWAVTLNRAYGEDPR